MASFRSPQERSPAEEIWFRTCYFDAEGNTTDAIHNQLFEQSVMYQDPVRMQPGCLLYDDAARYNYGSEWQKIFMRIPQKLRITQTPEAFERRKAQAIESVRNWKEAEAGSGDPEYQSQLDVLCSTYQSTNVVGMIYVADEEAFASGELLIAWYDEWGRVVRSNRMLPKDIDQLSGIMVIGAQYDMVEWVYGAIGDDYNVGGAFGPETL